MFNLFKRKKPEPPIIIIRDCIAYCKDGYLGENKCPRWVELMQKYPNGKETMVGKCAMAWVPSLLVEIKNKLEK